MNKLVLRAAIGGAALLLASCGGGSSGGGGGGGGGTANSPPAFTTAAELNAVEQPTGATPNLIEQLRASDANGDPVTFAILAGKDAALFEFRNGQNGALAFRQAPSFETPADGNKDNVFEVDISVTDGKATTQRSFRITLQNSKEGLVFRRVASGLPQNAHVTFDRFNDITHVISRDGLSVVRYNPRSNALTDLGPVSVFQGALAGAEILDVVPTEVGYSGFSIVARRGTTMYYAIARRDNPSVSQILWTQDFPTTTAPITASMWVGGGSPWMALGDGGIRNAAQNPDNLLGNAFEFSIFGGSDGTLSHAEARVASWGLRAPVLVTARERTLSLDRGPRFHEVNNESFIFPNTNFEWPIRDGLTNVGFGGTVQGNRAAPLRVQEIGVGGFGNWVAAATVFEAVGWSEVVIISDDQGNIITFDYQNNTPFELRNLDFTPDAGSVTRIVSMDGARLETSGSISHPLYMLDSDGELFRASVQ